MKYDYKVSVPEGQLGDWSIQKFTIGKKDLIEQMGSIYRTGRICPEGNYTRLIYKKRTTVMSDTPDEIRDHRSIIFEAKGDVLLVGLGLGVVLQAVARKEKVNHVTVIEKSFDVIGLVSVHYKRMFGDKIEIIQADIFDWKPPKGVYYDCIWFDIWNNLCEDNIDEMSTLHRKYGKKARWKGSWGKSFLLYQRDKEKRNRWY